MARPLKEIDWDVVERYIESGSNGVEIASDFRIQKQTFYRRFEEKYGVSFQNYHTDNQEAGGAKIRNMLYEKALNNEAPGNAMLLMFLARCRLGMKEPESVHLVAANQTQIDQSHENMELKHELAELKEKLKGQELVNKGLENEVDSLCEQKRELTGWG